MERTLTAPRGRWALRARPGKGIFIMAVLVITLGFFLVWPVLLILLNSFNTAQLMFGGAREWGLDNWRTAWAQPQLFRSLANTFLVWSLTVGISFPIAVGIAWSLARLRIPFSHTLEFMFWVSVMMPSISVTISWIFMLDPDYGLINRLLASLPFIDDYPFNIYSVPGIVWAHIMANGISFKVMLLTPAFRNMDASLEEASRVSGASNLRTMLRVTLPVMISPMVLVFAFQLLRIFQSFEIEQLLGTPIGFFVYSTSIYRLIATEVIPRYGEATVLGSVTLLAVAAIIPLQRWILGRRRYTTVSAGFRPGLINLGTGNYVVFGLIALLLTVLTVIPALMLLLGSFMVRSGWFELDPTYTLRHWQFVSNDPVFWGSLRTTAIIATVGGLASPILFSIIAYVLVRTRWPGRWVLDSIIWISGSVPGMLTGLGLLALFLGTAGLSVLYGTMWALLIVVILQGNTSGVNITKAVYVNIGADLEEAARISGSGWVRTYIRIWVPLLMPTLIMVGTLSFIFAAGATSAIILIASRDTYTLSILALALSSPEVGRREYAMVISVVLILMTVGVASVARGFGLHLGVRHQ